MKAGLQADLIANFTTDFPFFFFYIHGLICILSILNYCD
jgi:hypothetical protein